MIESDSSQAVKSFRSVSKVALKLTPIHAFNFNL
jgi:hypothetical protein